MRIAALIALCIAFRIPSYAQFLPDLQAKTPEEYDAYLDVLDGPVVPKGEAFLRAFPGSSLGLPVCELLTRASRDEGDANKAVAWASAGLAIAPDYIPLLVELADLLANGSRSLDRAAEAANHALKLLETARAPKRVGPDEWLSAVATLRAKAHGALGLVRFKRGDNDGAAREFEAALAVDSVEAPALHYRLGRLYASTGRKADARRHLEEAAKSRETKLRELAAAALAELR